MGREKNNSGVIALLIIIIFILLILCVLFATNIITLNINKDSGDNNINNINKDSENNNINTNNVSNDDKNDNDEQIVSRDDIVAKLKTVLTDQEWIEENLYAKENCFAEKVDNINQQLKFAVLSDNEGNPIVIVLNDTSESFILASYKVYYDDGEILVENITDSINHPSHVSFKVDKNQGIVVYYYGHMGYFTFKAYDIKNSEIKVYDEYNCTTGKCDYEYEGEKNYNISNIDSELNNANINKYLK